MRTTRVSIKHTFGIPCRSISVVNTIEGMQSWRHKLDVPKERLGFIPTMGALHNGHLSLVRAAKRECDRVVVSIFVNPKQFAAHEDLGTYPRTLEHDLELLRKEGVDVVFTPTESTMYGSYHRSYVEVEGFDQLSEGKSRPGFFRGVATVVLKLFNIVEPGKAFFGQKDAMQCAVIRRFVSDLNVNTCVCIVPTVRAEDGLALSSRNAYLSHAEREKAPLIFTGLKNAEALYLELRDHQDTIPSSMLADSVLKTYSDEPAVAGIDYISISSLETMDELSDVETSDGAIISVAVRIGTTRLIDNITLPPTVVK